MEDNKRPKILDDTPQPSPIDSSSSSVPIDSDSDGASSNRSCHSYLPNDEFEQQQNCRGREIGFNDLEGADEMTDIEFRRKHRVNRSTFNFLLELLRPQLIQPLEGLDGKALHQDSDNEPEKVLMFALSRMTMRRPDRFIDVEDCVLSTSTRWSCIRRVVNALIAHIHTFIRWPDQARAEEISTHFEKKYKMPNVVGALCPSFAETVRPASSCLTVPKKRTMPFQIISDHECLITHVIADLVARSLQDLRVFRQSRFESVFSEPGRHFAEKDHFVGDDNTRLIKTDPATDPTLDLLRKRFASLTDELPHRKINIIKYIFACCILHNICEMLNDRITDDVAYKEKIVD